MHLMSRPAACLALTTALLPAMLGTPTAQAVDALRAAPQVTRAEYKKVKVGMTKRKVKTIVGATGDVYSKGPDCLIKEYRAWSDQTAFFAFYVGKLDYKQHLNTSVQGYPPQCAGPS